MTRTQAATLLMATLVFGCAESDQVANALFASPTGMTVAGVDRTLLFVGNAGEDSVQVLDAPDGVSSLAFVPSSAQFFPLRIPAGENPVSLAATSDGRWVLVLNASTTSVRLIDATTLLTVRDAAGLPVQQILGAPSDAASVLVALPCNAELCDEFLVLLSGAGALVRFRLDTTQTPPNITDLRRYPVGGAPSHLSVGRLGEYAWVNDAESDVVVRLNLATGATGTVAVGAAAGVLAVSRDRDTLLVSRPIWRDVVIVDQATGTMVLRDADTARAPFPVCFADCATVGTDCADSHPADRAACFDATGFGVGETYEAIPFEAAVVGIETFGPEAEDPGLVARCDEETRTYDAFAVLTLSDGTLRYVGLSTAEGGAQAELVTATFCQEAVLEPLESEDVVETFLDACLSDGGRQRLRCLENGNAGVVVFPGTTGVFDVSIAFEGAIPGLDRSENGGLVLEDGRLTDLGVDFADFAIETRQTAPTGAVTAPGDIVEVLTTPLQNAACEEALGGDLRPCRLERRIVAVEPLPDARSALVLDRPLPFGCFDGVQNGGRLRYLIRAADDVIVTGLDGTYRMDLGARFGPGGDIGLSEPVGFRLRAIDTRSEVDACDRFVAEGENAGDAVAPLPNEFSRRRSTGFRVDDAFTVIRAGLDVNPQTGDFFAAGSLPFHTLADRFGSDSERLVFVTYSGSDSFLVFSPFDTAGAVAGADDFAILR